MTEKLLTEKLLIIGCGSIGRRHALSAQIMAQKNPGLVYALYDIDEARAKHLAEETGAQRYFMSLQEALRWQPDKALIASPHIYHVSQAFDILKSGSHIRSILIEKPLSHNLEEASELLLYLKSSSQKAFVVCNLRFHPAIKALHAHLPDIGVPYFSRAYYGNSLPLMRPGADYRQLYCARKETGGGVILDAIHEIDYLMWLLGPVNKVHSVSAKISDLDIDVEDFANITLVHENGMHSVITLDYLRPWKRRGCEIIGSEGTLIWQSEGKQPEICTVRFYRAADKSWTTLYHTEDLDNAQPFIDMLDAFLKDDPHSHFQTAEQAIKRLEIALAAQN